MDKKTILEKHVRDGDLYFKWLRGHGEGFNRKLYPPGDGEFASGSLIFTICFDEGQLTCFDDVYRKL